MLRMQLEAYDTQNFQYTYLGSENKLTAISDSGCDVVAETLQLAYPRMGMGNELILPSPGQSILQY
jgi:hypothetical protein